MSLKKNVLIVGGGLGGRLLKKDILNNYPYIKIIGFLDDQNICDKDIELLGKIDDFQKVNNTFKIDEIIIAIPSADGEVIRKIILSNLENNIPIKIVPRDQRIISSSKVKYSDIKDVDLEDFLGIRILKKNTEKLKTFYKNKTILITGGAGSIGSEIVRQLLDLGSKKIIVYDNSEYLIFNLDQNLKERGIPKQKYQLIIGDILNKGKFDRIVHQLKPDMIFHAAAYKHVYLMEDNIDEAIRNNVLGTQTVIDTAIKYKIKNFIFISTDKVVNPKGIMGATKKLCEYYVNYCRGTRTVFNIVRFGNVINSHGSVLPLFERQIKERKYVTITHKEIKRYFMSIREAAQLVITSAANRKEGQVFVLDMGELINVYDIALCLIRSKNLIPNRDVAIKFIGLKRGEKLVEELFTKSERGNIVKTKMDNIFKLKKIEKSPGNIKEYFLKLEKLLTGEQDTKKLRKFLQTMFPTLSN